MKIFKLKKDFRSNLHRLRIGTRFFEEVKTEGPSKVSFYHPENGGYAMWERDDYKFVDEYFEFVGETDKPKEYFINKVYTQEQFDNKPI